MEKVFFKVLLAWLYPMVLVLLMGQQSYAKVLIFTTAYNRPDFVEMQHKTFKKFLKDDYEYRVYNDADNPNMERAIREACERLGVPCIRVPQNFHTDVKEGRASFRHGESVQFAFEHGGFKHDDIVLLIDSDEFLLHEWSVREFLGDADVYILHEHMKPQLTIVNMPRLPAKETLNFRAGYIETGFMDAGSFTKYYVLGHPELKLKQGKMFWGLFRSYPIDVGVNKNGNNDAYLRSMGYTDAEIQLIKSIIALANATHNYSDADLGFYETNLFLDYKHGSDWHGPNAAVKAQKDKMIRDYINSLVR